MNRDLLRSLSDLVNVVGDVENEIDSLLDILVGELREIYEEIEELESIESVEEVEDIKLSLSSKIDKLISELY